jgi:hypothetical protein
MVGNPGTYVQTLTSKDFSKFCQERTTLTAETPDPLSTDQQYGTYNLTSSRIPNVKLESPRLKCCLC